MRELGVDRRFRAASEYHAKFDHDATACIGTGACPGTLIGTGARTGTRSAAEVISR